MSGNSGYGKMQASPFWRKVMGVTALLFVITLIIPTLYFLKYALFDHPLEVRAAEQISAPADALAHIRVADVDYYQELTKSAKPTTRIAGIHALGAMVLLPAAQMKYPIECLHAKLALESVLETDPNPAVRAAALQTLLQVASHGAVIKR